MSTVKAVNFQHPSATTTNLTLAADGTVSGNAPWGGRNRIINGGFDIWQRGTSFSYSGPSGDYAADRWAYYTDGTGSAVTVSRQTFTPGAAPVAGYEGTYFLRYNRTAAGTGNTYSNLQQPIEDVRVFAGQTVTISFWAKADAARSVGVSMNQDFGSGGSAAVGLGVIGTASVTTSWQRFSFTASLPSISGKTIGTSSKLYLFLYMGNVVSTVDVWGVQVEAGSAATPFEVKPIGDTLFDCQRYYQIIMDANNNVNQNIASVYTSGAAFFSISLKRPLRTSSANVINNTLRLSLYTAAVSQGNVQIDNSYPNASSCGFRIATSGLTAGQAGHVDHASGSVHISAEL